MKKPKLTPVAPNNGLSRRDFFKATGTGAAGLCVAGAGTDASAALLRARQLQDAAATREATDVKVVHSVCLACNARCGVRGVVRDGKLVNISGNPYHPYNMCFSGIAYETPIKDSLLVNSPVCGKSHDTANHTYSPYRILKPLKRSGPRGSGRFEPIEWEQLVEEIAEGGKLFAHLGEERHIAGLRELDSDQPIDSAAPELGSRRNGLVFITGRLQSGRKEFIDRFVKGAMGSKNRIGHTDICGLGFRMGNYALTEGRQVELKADPLSAEYILVFGANIYEALQPGINTYGALVARRRAEGSLRFSVADPRATNASAHAESWLPVKPGQDGALAMGIARWIIENNRHNRAYLSAPNLKAAHQRGFASYCNGSHLVICDPTHPHDGKLLRCQDIDPSRGGAPGKQPMVLTSPQHTPVPADTADDPLLEAEAVVHDYFGNAIRVKTAFGLLKAAVMEHSLEEYAGFCGVPVKQIAQVAHDFSGYGTRAAVTQYHGAGNYVSGTYAAYAVAVLSALVGSIDMRGGYMQSGGGAGSQKHGRYDLTTFPGKPKASGVAISREKFAYEKTTEYRRKKAAGGTGYPARRPWFPFTRGGLSTEAMSGIDQQYPYPCKVLFTYLYNPVYSIPGGYRYKSTLGNTETLPLHISLDVAINETNLYADYIVPELTYPEGHYGWLTPHAPTLKFTGLRTSMIEPLTGKTRDGRHFCTETLLIDLAERIGLPGFGKQAIPDAAGTLHPLHRGEDFYLRAFANIAHNADAPQATREEIAFVEHNYPVARYKDVLPEPQWRQVCSMLARGGIFRTYQSLFDGDRFQHGLGEYALYNEKLATTRNSLTGERFNGTLQYIPPKISSGQVMTELDKDFPFAVVTYKRNLMTQSRSLWFSYGMEILPENYIQMHEEDASRMGIKEMDVVRLVSRSNPEGIEGKVKRTRLIRPGCLGVSCHYGHTQFGGSRLAVKDAATVFQGGRSVTDEQGLIPNPKYRTGLNFNDVARLDEQLGNTPMVDLVGGIPDFSSTRVKVIKQS